MATTSTTQFMTVAEFERFDLPVGRWELIDGELVEVGPEGRRHTRLVAALIYHLMAHVSPSRLGEVLTPDSGVVLAEHPLMIRVPDTGFVRADRLAGETDERGFYRVVPDLIVEVNSPTDRPGEVIAKAVLWLEAGAAVVWSVDPDSTTVTIFTPGALPRVLTVDDTLTGDDLLPGFALPLRELFSA
jgi:Uma2 family endonuclease